jgi:ketosteroid isomerase-like protein
MTEDLTALVARLERLEAAEAIRDLAARYARYVDAKDMDALVQLFVDDVVVGAEVGRDARRRAFVRNHGRGGRFGTTIHLVTGHTVDLDQSAPDRARGVVYCRAEHEIDDKWVIATIQYWDEYERRDGAWQFAVRDIKAFYVVDVLERPNGDLVKQRLTNVGVLEKAELPFAWPSWSEFWRQQALGSEP